MRTSLLPRDSDSTLMLLTRLLLAAFVAGLSFLAALALFLLAVRLVFTDRALPGVRSGEAALSGKTAAQIAETVATAYTYPQTGLVALRDGAAVWTATPAQLGVRIDGAAMAGQALSIGRRGSFAQRLQEQIDAWATGYDVAPVIVFDHAVGEIVLLRISA